ncbi:hypothetical protein E7934_13460 [Salmonella enterica]|uniref:hypothetical protein n=1 Tax=Salmonella enterica TaxID=28901 RepID=UPI0005F2CA03|nr:hypothetical protein [Salmonella enterica]ECM4919978.1 hypothetical protein [Salmonella enterica subsp. enterica serovar Heidelberg]EDW1661547.1 hypothetical protein [Salmonella enterica subsp. enterica serovar Typhimurium]KJU57533.1 phage protein [Salmonella enterica subsp. enterica serovar Heidelberg str. 90-0318]QMP18340.1 hypothetical protein [Salmonella virus PAT1]QMP81892.1 EaE-like protein [Salmonella phage 65FD]QMP81934.1 EaE-like protein [Salmonella phage 66FD]
MGSNIIELAKLGHERAAELKASCGAVDVRNVAQLISDLATQLEVQLVRGNAQAVQLANAESKCRELAAELSAVDKIHNEAVFITDDHYEQCPPEVQKMIRSLAVLQIPAYDAYLAEVRASARNEGINYAASRLAAAFNHGFVDKPLAEVCDVVRMILDTKEELANSTLPAADGISGEYAEKFLAEFAAQLRKGSAL